MINYYLMVDSDGRICGSGSAIDISGAMIMAARKNLSFELVDEDTYNNVSGKLYIDGKLVDEPVAAAEVSTLLEDIGKVREELKSMKTADLLSPIDINGVLYNADTDARLSINDALMLNNSSYLWLGYNNMPNYVTYDELKHIQLSIATRADVIMNDYMAKLDALSRVATDAELDEFKTSLGIVDNTTVELFVNEVQLN